jgi:hypothetical protein
LRTSRKAPARAGWTSRARLLIADLASGALSAGFVHSCLRKAAGLIAEPIRLIRALIAASSVAGFDETNSSQAQVLPLTRRELAKADTYCGYAGLTRTESARYTQAQIRSLFPGAAAAPGPEWLPAR